MLAARDQENRLFAHQAGAKQLPKTPGARYPKTPLKIPLNDENATRALGGKSILAERAKGGDENVRTFGKGKAAQKSTFVTPFEPRTARAPLGNKTTNAKARTGQVAGVKQIVQEIEKGQGQATAARRPTVRSPQAAPAKLAIHSDKNERSDNDDEIEYAPPPVEEEPYQSDVLPDGVLTFDAFKPENRLKGYYRYYFNPVDDDGVSRKEKEFAEQKRKAFERLDDQVLKDLEEFDWSVADVPETKNMFKKIQVKEDPAVAGPSVVQRAPRLATKPPSTVASRRAASALAMRPKLPMTTTTTTTTTAPQPKASKPINAKAASFILPGKKATAQAAPLKDNATAAAASRTTLGYNKGRSALSVVQGRSASANTTTARTFARTDSTVSSGSDTTITPSRYAQKQANKADADDEWKRLEFLSIFNADEEDGGNLGGPINDDLDDDFQFDVKF